MANPRTYIPALVKSLNWVCKYVAKHSTVLARWLSPEQMTLLNAVVAACVAFTDSIAAPEILP